MHMDLSLLAIGAIAVIVMSLLVGLALALLAEGTDEVDRDAGMLVKLASLRSPSGRPFFANPEAMQDFVTTLDDTRDEERTRR
jgi:hypothetical protein